MICPQTDESVHANNFENPLVGRYNYSTCTMHSRTVVAALRFMRTRCQEKDMGTTAQATALVLTGVHCMYVSVVCHPKMFADVVVRRFESTVSCSGCLLILECAYFSVVFSSSRMWRFETFHSIILEIIRFFFLFLRPFLEFPIIINQLIYINDNASSLVVVQSNYYCAIALSLSSSERNFSRAHQ